MGKYTLHDSDKYMQVIPKQYLSSGCESLTLQRRKKMDVRYLVRRQKEDASRIRTYALEEEQISNLLVQSRASHAPF